MVDAPMVRAFAVEPIDHLELNVCKTGEITMVLLWRNCIHPLDAHISAATHSQYRFFSTARSWNDFHLIFHFTLKPDAIVETMSLLRWHRQCHFAAHWCSSALWWGGEVNVYQDMWWLFVHNSDFSRIKAAASSIVTKCVACHTISICSIDFLSCATHSSGSPWWWIFFPKATNDTMVDGKKIALRMIR